MSNDHQNYGMAGNSYYEEADLNGDGIVDSLLVDNNGDGQVDEIYMDANQDSMYEALMVDSDGNGDFDVMLVDSDGDGYLEAAIADTNVDGIYDTIYVDSDGDGYKEMVVLDYNQDGSAHKDEYIQMFEDCGWEYMQEYAGYSYFRKSEKEMDTKESIFCDDSSRLQMMERVFRGRLLPLGILFLCCILPQFIFQTGVFHNYALAGLFGAITGLYVCVFVLYGVHYFRFKSKMKK